MWIWIAGWRAGLASTGTLDSRDKYLDAAVQRRLEGWGTAGADAAIGAAGADTRHQQQVGTDCLDERNDAGRLGGGCSAANDQAARQVVLEKADTLARGFNAAAVGLTGVQTSSELSFANGVERVNQVASRLPISTS